MKPDLKIVFISIISLSLLFCKPDRQYRPDSGISTGAIAEKEAHIKEHKEDFEKILVGKWELISYNCNREGKYCTPLKNKTILTFDNKRAMQTDRFDFQNGKLIEHFQDLYRLAWFQPAGQWIIELNSYYNYGIIYEINEDRMLLTPNGKSFDTFQKLN